jgi:hypothetical protein
VVTILQHNIPDTNTALVMFSFKKQTHNVKVNFGQSRVSLLTDTYRFLLYLELGFYPENCYPKITSVRTDLRFRRA